MPDPPDDHRGKTLDYESWPQRRKTPKPIKIAIWAALIVHGLGIGPALIFLWYVSTDPSSGLFSVLTSGACCIPFALLVLLSIFIVVSRIGDR